MLKIETEDDYHDRKSDDDCGDAVDDVDEGPAQKGDQPVGW